LKKKGLTLKKWETEKQNYQLQRISDDTFAYASKPNADSASLAHFICTNCYERRNKSILQRADIAHVFCPDCHTKFRYDSVVAKSQWRTSYNPRGGSP
jgi:hypothetical protein